MKKRKSIRERIGIHLIYCDTHLEYWQIKELTKSLTRLVQKIVRERK